MHNKYTKKAIIHVVLIKDIIMTGENATITTHIHVYISHQHRQRS